jgi:hypothetical protein
MLPRPNPKALEYYHLKKQSCDDCGIDTSHSYGHCEYYMVHDFIWRQAQRDGVAPSILCIGCLENRLGRQLIGDDFMKLPLDDHSFWEGMSPRMRDRVSRRGSETQKET